MFIPGQNQLFSGSGEFPKSIMLLVGPSGSGKTAYSIQFLKEGISTDDHSLYINCSQALTQARFDSYFPKPTTKGLAFVSLFSGQRPGLSQFENLSNLLERITSLLPQSEQSSESTTRVVLDSLTDMIARFPNEAVQKFVAELYDLLKRYTTQSPSLRLQATLRHRRLIRWDH